MNNRLGVDLKTELQLLGFIEVVEILTYFVHQDHRIMVKEYPHVISVWSNKSAASFHVPENGQDAAIKYIKELINV